MSTETRDAITAIARDDFGGVTADEAVRRLAQEHHRALWVEQARRLREEQPEMWEATTSELAVMADGAVGDGLAHEPWDDRA